MRMTGRIMIALVLALCCLPAAAQDVKDDFENSLTVGGKAGMGLSKILFYPSVPQTLIGGAMVGVTARYVEEKYFGLILEFLVEQRGWKETFKETDYQYEHKLTYIQVPFLTHIYFGGRKLHGFFNAGPELGYMIAESASSNFDVNNYASLADFPVDNRSNEQLTMEIKNRFDYGISAGLGLEYFATRQHSVVLEGRFYYGLGNIFGASKSDVFSASRSMSIQITLGYNFRLK